MKILMMILTILVISCGKKNNLLQEVEKRFAVTSTIDFDGDLLVGTNDPDPYRSNLPDIEWKANSVTLDYAYDVTSPRQWNRHQYWRGQLIRNYSEFTSTGTSSIDIPFWSMYQIQLYDPMNYPWIEKSNGQSSNLNIEWEYQWKDNKGKIISTNKNEFVTISDCSKKQTPKQVIVTTQNYGSQDVWGCPKETDKDFEYLKMATENNSYLILTSNGSETKWSYISTQVPLRQALAKYFPEVILEDFNTPKKVKLGQWFVLSPRAINPDKSPEKKSVFAFLKLESEAEYANMVSTWKKIADYTVLREQGIGHTTNIPLQNGGLYSFGISTVSQNQKILYPPPGANTTSPCPIRSNELLPVISRFDNSKFLELKIQHSLGVSYLYEYFTRGKDLIVGHTPNLTALYGFVASETLLKLQLSNYTTAESDYCGYYLGEEKFYLATLKLFQYI